MESTVGFKLHAQVIEIVRAAERAEFVDDLVAGLVAEKIDAGDIDQEIEAEIIFEMEGGGADDVAVDLDRDVAAKFPRQADFAGKLLLEGGDGFSGGHESRIFDGIYGMKAGEF